MHEMTRMAYLEVLGIDSYVSRRQLPGAAVTRRMAVLPKAESESAAEAAERPASQGAGAILEAVYGDSAHGG